jgi:hypothetical protein
MKDRPTRAALAMLAAVSIALVGLVLLGFGTGWLALTDTPRPVGRLRPADLQPAISEVEPVVTQPSTTIVSVPITEPSTTVGTTHTTQPNSTQSRPSDSTVTPTTRRGDGDNDADD